MSPASSGPLEVERYIGACLISSQQSRHKKSAHHYHHQQQHHQHQQQLPHRPEGFYSGASYHRLQRCASGAGGGVPLLFNPHYANESLSRLAVQTQGIPLILSNKYHNRRSKQRGAQFNQNNGGVYVKDKRDKQETQCTDTVSIASDESCVSSNASDTCLPRIIKPRKRRKKDRKPQHALRPLDSAYSSAQDTCSSGGSATSSPDIDYNSRFVLTPPQHQYYMNYPAAGYHFEDYPRQQQPQHQHQHQQQRQISVVHSEDKSETPKLNHLFEDVVEALDEKDLNGNETSCQCRYCNPSGQIWDMDRGCYSPYLTSPLNLLNSSPGEFNRAPGRSHLRRHSSDAQSLLESMSTMSLEDAASSTSSLSSSSVPAMMSAPNSPNLEVSTEIVTSHNGHRDLEIKFFSSFSGSGRTELGSPCGDVRESAPFDWTILGIGTPARNSEQCSSSNDK